MNTSTEFRATGLTEEPTLTLSTTSDRLAETIFTDSAETQIVNKVALGVVKNRRMVMLPRKQQDRRFREWTKAEKQLVVKLYKAGKSRHSICRLMEVSHCPLNRLLYGEGVLKPNHIAAAQRLGQI